MTLNEIAYERWQLATTCLDQAVAEEDVNSAIALTSVGELALKAAQFAVNNPALVKGEDDEQDDWAARVAQAQAQSDTQHNANPVAPPKGPAGGPKVWG